MRCAPREAPSLQPLASLTPTFHQTQEVYDPSKAYTDPAYPRSDPRTPKFEADRLLEYHNSKDGPYRSQSAPQNALSKHLNSLSPEEAEKLRRVLAVNAGDDLRIAVLDSAADQRMYNPEDVQAAADAGGARLVRAQIRALGGAPLAPTPASHRA